MVLKRLHQLQEVVGVANDFLLRVQGKIPFASHHLESMVGHEFYMVVAGSQLQRRMEERGMSNPRYGHILEVTSRSAGKVEGYRLGYITNTTYEDGTAVGDTIQLMECFILRLDIVDLQDQERPILCGIAQKYRGTDNYLYEEKYRMNVYLDQLVKYKSLGKMVTI